VVFAIRLGRARNRAMVIAVVFGLTFMSGVAYAATRGNMAINSTVRIAPQTEPEDKFPAYEWLEDDEEAEDGYEEDIIEEDYDANPEQDEEKDEEQDEEQDEDVADEEEYEGGPQENEEDEYPEDPAQDDNDYAIDPGYYDDLSS